MAEKVSELLRALHTGYRAGRHVRAAEAAPRPAPSSPSAQTVVEYRTDPGFPFTQVTIFAPTEQGVQTEIERAMRSVERDGATATFRGPRRCLYGYGAIGEIVAFAQAAE